MIVGKKDLSDEQNLMQTLGELNELKALKNKTERQEVAVTLLELKYLAWQEIIKKKITKRLLSEKLARKKLK